METSGGQAARRRLENNGRRGGKEERAAGERAGSSRVEATKTEEAVRRSRRRASAGVPEAGVGQHVPARSSSGGPSKVQGRGLLSGSCQGAEVGAGFVDEAYLVQSSWVVA
ncbi:hypothetical protein MTO96_027968 [Rhipicephalus appendiculatus]